jgi:hypothetical protein
MLCSKCSKLVENSIEGKLICSICWQQGQLTENEKGIDRLITEGLSQEKLNDQFLTLLKSYGVFPDYTDGYGCQIENIWFEASVYLGDLDNMTINQIARELAENIKAVFAELI